MMHPDKSLPVAAASSHYQNTLSCCQSLWTKAVLRQVSAMVYVTHYTQTHFSVNAFGISGKKYESSGNYFRSFSSFRRFSIASTTVRSTLILA